MGDLVRRPTWRAVAGSTLALLLFPPLLAGCGLTGTPSVKADVKPYARDVHTRGTVALSFSQAMDRASVERGLELLPSALSQALQWPSAQQLRATWRLQPGQKYLLRLVQARSRDGSRMRDWSLHFTTAYPPEVAGVEIDGKPLTENQRGVPPQPQITVRFSEPMEPEPPPITLDGRPVGSVEWASDLRSGSFAAPLAAGARHVIRWAEGARSRAAEPPAGAWEFSFFAAPALPSNGHALSGNPMLVQIENSQPSRPQLGLQQADIVYEYLSEYEISRFTAVYYNGPPAVVGPVRSARLISIALQGMFHGALFSSGASGPVSRLLSGRPAYLGNAEAGFYRDNSRYAPHNLMIRGESMLTARERFGNLHPNFAVDLPHPDVEWPASAPSGDIDVPVHQARWHFLPEDGSYVRTDHGTPFVDGSSGQPLRAKNIVLQTVRWSLSSIIEDGCCTRGLEYQMTGDGDALYFSNGKVLAGRWRHPDANAPIEFLDQEGNPVPFNSGLTWVHVR